MLEWPVGVSWLMLSPSLKRSFDRFLKLLQFWLHATGLVHALYQTGVSAVDVSTTVRSTNCRATSVSGMGSRPSVPAQHAVEDEVFNGVVGSSAIEGRNNVIFFSSFDIKVCRFL